MDDHPLGVQAEILSSEPKGTRSLFVPSHKRALDSAKLSALHARLSLPAKLPLQTLARCLVDPSADPRPGFNNAPFAVLGQDLLGYYTTEYLSCHYPRLPMSVLFAAQYAYVGPATLGSIRTEWGVEVVAAPGTETDPGLLQVKRVLPGNALDVGAERKGSEMPGVRRLGGLGRKNAEWHYRRGISSRMVYDDEFGDLQSADVAVGEKVDSQPYPGAATSTASSAQGDEAGTSSNEEDFVRDNVSYLPTHPSETEPVTVQDASASFVRALAGAIYLHAGAPTVKSFHADHILSRNLKLDTLFHFTHPTRDLSRLCARENFEPPVARLISETGRLSRTPVFVVGVFSGHEKLGEAAGASLNEGRVRAAVQALKGWYLYSPPPGEIVLPSEIEGKGNDGKRWRSQVVDLGEIIT